MRLRHVLFGLTAAQISYFLVRHHKEIHQNLLEQIALLGQLKKEKNEFQEQLERIQAFQEPLTTLAKGLSDSYHNYHKSTKNHCQQLQGIHENTSKSNLSNDCHANRHYLSNKRLKQKLSARSSGSYL